MMKFMVISHIDHTFDVYADQFYVEDNEIDDLDQYFEYKPTQTERKEMDTLFIIPTPKRTHRSKLSPVVHLKIKAISGIGLGRPLVALCDSGSTGTLIKDSSLPFGAKPTITKEATYSTTTQGTHKCN